MKMYKYEKKKKKFSEDDFFIIESFANIKLFNFLNISYIGRFVQEYQHYHHTW